MFTIVCKLPVICGVIRAHYSDHCSSTETTLLKVCADLIEAMDQGNHVLLGLLALSAAFDTVEQDILIERLSRSFGIRSTALNWFCSYLIDRKLSVQFSGDVSTVKNL